jgi:hypothetical protein
MGVGDYSIHFREPYPAPSNFGGGRGVMNPDFGNLGGRKTILDEFHTDEHDPSRFPKEHLLHDLLHLPEGFEYIPWSLDYPFY